MSRYINLLTDFGFKFIFANERHKEFLLDFLNTVMAFQNVQVKEISYKNTEIVGENEDERRAIIDLCCTNEKGEHFLIEVQRATQIFFKKRILFYVSRLIQEQGVKGEEWNYNYKGVYSIAILERSLYRSSGVIETYRILNEKTYESYIEDFGIILIHLDQFQKKEDELETNFDNWMFLLKHLHVLDTVPLALQRRLFIRLLKLAEYGALNTNQQREYMNSLKRYNDFNNILTTYQHEISHVQELLEEERKRAEEERKRAEILNFSLKKMIEMMRLKGIKEEEIEKNLGIKISDLE